MTEVTKISEKAEIWYSRTPHPSEQYTKRLVRDDCGWLSYGAGCVVQTGFSQISRRISNFGGKVSSKTLRGPKNTQIVFHKKISSDA